MAISIDFASTGMALGYGIMSVAYESRPDELADHLHAQMKVAVKYLSKVTSRSQSDAYEALSRATGFDNWHRLHTHLDRPKKTGGRISNEWFEALLPLLPIYAGVPRELPPEAKCQELLENLWTKVASELSVPPIVVLDGVGAQMLGERTWAALLARSPLEAKAPLYTFERSEADNSGAFEWSNACGALVEALDAQWQGYSEFPAAKQKAARRWVESALRSQPDFLEAGLALAQMKADENEPDAANVLDAFLARANALIPKDFDGTLSWYSVGNRFYHRMLYLRMTMYSKAGDIRAAVKVVRKMLKLNPDDNLGVRDNLPLMLLAIGDVAGAKRACKHIAKEKEYQSAAIHAFVAYATGDLTRFRAMMLTSLFTWPPIRVFAQNSERGMAVDEPGHRGAIFDYETFAQAAWPAFNAVTGLRDDADSLFREPQVIAAESALRAAWLAFDTTGDWSRRARQVAAWQASVQAHVAKLATAL